MDGLVKNMLLATFILSLCWESSNSYNLNHNISAKMYKNRSVVSLITQTPLQSCKSDVLQFQCATTADCISFELECDGKEDCPDGSDEKASVCKGAKSEVRYNRQTNTNKQCTLAQPANGEWIYQINGTKGDANSRIDANTIIKLSCNHGYKLSNTNEASLFIVCLPTGEWSVRVLPTCQKLCPSLYDSHHITFSCKYYHLFMLYPIPCDKAIDHTILTYKCAPYYEPLHERFKSSTCYDGSWDNIPDCIPVCGEKSVSATPLIVNGHEVERGNYPWMVALYRSTKSNPLFTNICGGSLITTEVVLTAAHCVTPKSDVKYFRVAAGKYYNQYEDYRDTNTAQYADISLIETYHEYRGSIQNYRGDIAILKLKTNLALSEAVQPVCYINLPIIEPNMVGVVTGWGYTTSSGEPSETLKELELPYNANKQCFNDLDKDFAERYLISDKFCAGFNNENKSVCKGDSGSGLVFRNPDYKNRFFIHGIVSVAQPYLKNNLIHCNTQRSTLFTRVDTYIDWIQLKVREWTTNKDKRCTPLVHPEHGRWVYLNNSSKDIYNQEIDVNHAIILSCNQGYQEVSSATNENSHPIFCMPNGKWSITVTPFCQKLNPNDPTGNSICVESVTKVQGKTNICSGDEIANYKFTESIIDQQFWQVEQYIPGAPDYEYVIYKNEPDVIGIENDVLRIKPKVVEENVMKTIVIDECTRPSPPPRNSPDCSKLFQGLFQNPIVSGQIVSKVAFCFAQVSIRAKLPQGDWVYPEIYLEDINDPHNRIVIAFTRGNKELKYDGTDIGGKLLMGGPYLVDNDITRNHIRKYLVSHIGQTHIGNDWHTFTVKWTKDRMDLFIDDINYGIIHADALQATGFNKETMVRLVIGEGAGGANNFPDNSTSGLYAKPWRSKGRHAVRDFFRDRDNWLKTWNEDTQLLVEYVTIKAL